MCIVGRKRVDVRPKSASRWNGSGSTKSRVSIAKNVDTNQSFSCHRTVKWIYLVDCPRLVENYKRDKRVWG